MAKRKPRIRQAEIVQQFAARLRELRQAQSLTQAELARRAHVALSHLGKLEAGDAAPGLDLLDRLAVALGTTVNGLLPSQTDERELALLRERTRQQFDAVIQRANAETLSALVVVLSRF